jgi:hypothetical protein
MIKTQIVRDINVCMLYNLTASRKPMKNTSEITTKENKPNKKENKPNKKENIPSRRSSGRF